MDKTSKTGKSLPAAFAFGLAAMSCVFGLIFCLVQGPEARSAGYQAAAITALSGFENDAAVDAAMEAARLHPSSASAWNILSFSLNRNGRPVAAAQAKEIAARIEGRAPAIIAYAPPAALKVSMMMTTEGDIVR